MQNFRAYLEAKRIVTKEHCLLKHGCIRWAFWLSKYAFFIQLWNRRKIPYIVIFIFSAIRGVTAIYPPF